MSKRSVEKGLNASNIGYGLLIMILAATIFFYSGAAILTLILLYSTILILSGMVRIINSVSNEELSNSAYKYKPIQLYIPISFYFSLYL